MKGRPIAYTEQEVEWIRERATTPRRELWGQFCKAFNRDDVALTNFVALCKRNKIMTGRNGQFVPGQVPMNKGQKMPFNANSAKTQFKAGRLPHNTKGAGHEMVCPKYGYVFMIVAESNPHTGGATRRVLKHKWLWEQLNGPVPKGHCLKSVDGDRQNTSPANWMAIPRTLLPRLNGRWNSLNYDTAEPELRPYLLAAARLRDAARKLQRNTAKG